MNTAKLITASANALWVLASAFTSAARASDAETSATATRGRSRSGTATATARYEGNVGFARTDTRTGAVNLARGVAVGVDEDGISLSVSLAIAPQRGPAYATNFNLSFDTDGDSASSFGTAAATGGTRRTVTAGGRTSAAPMGPIATSMAGGATHNGGMVRAITHSDRRVHRAPVPRRIIRIR
jgi:hypothetical protein